MKKLILILIILTGFLSCQSNKSQEVGANKSQEVGANKSQEVGAFYQGGVVFYIFEDGDTGYVAGETHGLIAAIADQGSGGIGWYDDGTLRKEEERRIWTTGRAVGTGSANTDAIINVQGATETSYAAGLARAYTGGGYTDWFLPSIDELNKMYINKTTLDAVAGFTPFSSFYWSSTEYNNDNAWLQFFENGIQLDVGKKYTNYAVRAVRAF